MLEDDFKSCRFENADLRLWIFILRCYFRELFRIPLDIDDIIVDVLTVPKSGTRGPLTAN